MRKTRIAAFTAVLAALCAFPALSSAAVATIDGNPLNISVDEFGAIQARFDNQTNGEFFPPTSDTASAGFHIALYDTAGSTFYGPAGSTMTPLDQDGDFEPDTPVLLPSSNGFHQMLVSTTVADQLRVDQLIQYQDGQREFFMFAAVENITDRPITFSAAEYADLFLGGDDRGSGFLLDGPPRIVGGVTPPQPGQIRTPGGGIVEITPPWSAYEVGPYLTVRDHLSNLQGPALDNTIVQEVVDNGVGVQWDDFKNTALAPGDDTGYALSWRFTDFAVPPPPPEPGESVNVEPEGVVRVKFPRGFTPPSSDDGTAARTAQSNKFQRITDPVQIPVGSIVDTRKGSIEMTSAANLTGGTQKGNFSRGLFRITQRSAARPFTNLRLRGGSFRRCRSRGSSAETSRRRVIRRLRGNARGRYRTRGRRSSATVRGTVWTMTETCAGTLTTVSRGKVVVRDFGRKRNITLRKGDRYLARNRRR